MKYLMDANTYIEAKNKYYGMDFCPGYWDWLIDQFAMGNVASIDFVGKELEKGNDKLREWCRSHRDHFIESNDLDTQAEYYEVVNFVMAGKYNPGNRDGFLKGADPWLIAKSKSTGAVLVTHEVVFRILCHFFILCKREMTHDQTNIRHGSRTASSA